MKKYTMSLIPISDLVIAKKSSYPQNMQKLYGKSVVFHLFSDHWPPLINEILFYHLVLLSAKELQPIKVSVVMGKSSFD